MWAIKYLISVIRYEEEEEADKRTMSETPLRTSTPTSDPKEHVAGNDDKTGATSAIPTIDARAIDAMSKDEKMEQQRQCRKRLGLGKRRITAEELARRHEAQTLLAKQQRAYLDGRAVVIDGGKLLEPRTIPFLSSRTVSGPPGQKTDYEKRMESGSRKGTHQRR